MEPPSPFTPLLNALIDVARQQFAQWREHLFGAVVKTTGETGQKLPLDDTTRSRLARVYDAYGNALRYRFSGTLADPERKPALLKSPAMLADSAAVIPVVAAYKTGSRWDGERVPQMRGPAKDDQESQARAQAALKLTLKLDMSDWREASMREAQERAGNLITKVSDSAIRTIGDVLNRNSQAWTDEQLAPVRDMAAQAIRDRWTKERFKQRLWEAIADSTIPGVKDMTNNLDRIVATELQFAYWRGAVDRMVEEAGTTDLDVFVIASPDACTECKRIWGLMPHPHVYKLSEIVANGTNRGLKPKDWRAIVGPIHPRCMCPPPLKYRPKVVSAVEKAMDLWAKQDAAVKP